MLSADDSAVELKHGLRVLALGPHADDIELGCAATLLYLKHCCGAQVFYVVFCDHSHERRHQRNRLAEIRKAAELLGVPTDNDTHFRFKGYRDTRFPESWRDIQEYVSELRDEIEPQIVLAPRADNHQDHVVVADAATREFRGTEMLLQYEIKQFGQEQFKPALFVNVAKAAGTCWDAPIEADYAEFLKYFSIARRIGDADDVKWETTRATDTFAHRKTYILLRCMFSQCPKPFMNAELLLGTMRFRGMQCSPRIPYAEAFEGRLRL